MQQRSEETPIQISRQTEKSRYAFVSGHTGEGAFSFCVGYEACRPDYVIDRTQFPFWTLEFIVDGRGELLLNGKEYELGPGSVFCYGRSVAHAFRNHPETPFRKYFLARTSSGFPESWAQSGLEPGRVVNLAPGAPLTPVFEQMLQEGVEHDLEALAIIRALQRVLLALIHRYSSAREDRPPASKRAYEMALETLGLEFRTLKSLADLAARTGFSPEYLCRVFRRYGAQSPYQVLLGRKINEAFLLLRDGNRLVGDVAREVGFDDPLHFSRLFRRQMGFPPSEVGR